MTAEEKISRLGAKGGIHIVVSAHDKVPTALAPVAAKLSKPDDKPALNIVWLKHILVGGSASNMVIAGEKLPDPEGHPLYKVMTFTNAVRASMVESNADLITAATGFKRADIPRLANTANLLVLLHEYGHTLGDHAEFLGELGSSVEETNAEASALYLTQRYAPESLIDMIGLIACWTPVRRTLQGPAEPHSHSDIVLFDELLASGGVRSETRGQSVVVVPGNPDDAVRCAFTLALRMRLWEIGVPWNRHEQWIEPFDENDAEQDAWILRRAREELRGMDELELEGWRAEVTKEVKEYFASERLERIAAPLAKVIEHLPRFQPLTVIPTDNRMQLVLSTAPA